MNTGGPAFPRSATMHPRGGMAVSPQAGMTLRDWFAGQALAGLVQYTELEGMVGPLVDFEVSAADAYRLADAMLREREIDRHRTQEESHGDRSPDPSPD